jgi:predicted DNA-binding transcriptional regulator YafY
VAFHPGDTEAKTRWVLSWGSKAKVLGPPELKQRVREELEGMMKACG